MIDIKAERETRDRLSGDFESESREQEGET